MATGMAFAVAAVVEAARRAMLSLMVADGLARDSDWYKKACPIYRLLRRRLVLSKLAIPNSLHLHHQPPTYLPRSTTQDK